MVVVCCALACNYVCCSRVLYRMTTHTNSAHVRSVLAYVIIEGQSSLLPFRVILLRICIIIHIGIVYCNFYICGKIKVFSQQPFLTIHKRSMCEKFTSFQFHFFRLFASSVVGRTAIASNSLNYRAYMQQRN